MYYSSIGLLAALLLVIINYDIIIKNSFEGVIRANKEFRRYLFSVLFFYAADIIWGFVFDAKSAFFSSLDTYLFFGFMAVSVFLWTRYVITYLADNSTFCGFIKWTGILIFAFVVVSLFINIFTPVVFYFTDTCEYYPQPTRYVIMGLQFLMNFVTSVHCFVVYGKKHGELRLHYRAIGTAGLVTTIFIVFQNLNAFMPFYSIGCMIATCMIHQFVLEEDKNELQRELLQALDNEKRQRREVENAKSIAYTDALTGVKSKHAFVEMESDLDEKIVNHNISELGIATFDLNDLKRINDTKGHEAGDDYIKEGCQLICKTFQHSPVFRVGGDEFTVILQGEDYMNRHELLEIFEAKVDKNLREGKVVVASGLAYYRPGDDSNFRQVYERADRRMYRRKAELKEM